MQPELPTKSKSPAPQARRSVEVRLMAILSSPVDEALEASRRFRWRPSCFRGFDAAPLTRAEFSRSGPISQGQSVIELWNGQTMNEILDHPDFQVSSESLTSDFLAIQDSTSDQSRKFVRIKLDHLFGGDRLSKMNAKRVGSGE